MKDDVICVARYRQVGHGTIGLRELPIVIWPLVGLFDCLWSGKL